MLSIRLNHHAAAAVFFVCVFATMTTTAFVTTRGDERRGLAHAVELASSRASNTSTALGDLWAGVAAP